MKHRLRKHLIEMTSNGISVLYTSEKLVFRAINSSAQRIRRAIPEMSSTVSRRIPI